MPPREISTDGRIVPIARLGVGGMGEVLLARRTGVLGFEKLIAVKIIRADKAHHPESRRMFTDEARLLSRLDHPSIAQVHDLGEQDGVLYLTMEYVAGIALGALLGRRKAPFPPGIAAQIVAAAARGAHAAHELTDLAGEPLGVVHRDLSPQNVMVTFDGRVKVLDFGVAWMRDREAESTDTGAVKGKLAYLAPEQIKGQPVDRRADVYALSIVLHELLTARRLFGGDSLAAALRRPKVAPPSAKQPAVSPELDAIVMRGLERDPEARWPDARALAQALEEEVRRLGSEPLEAFVTRELADLAAENRAFLRRAMASPEAVTLEAAPIVGGTEVLTGESAAPRRRRWPWVAALVVLAAAVAPGLAEVRARLERQDLSAVEGAGVVMAPVEAPRAAEIVPEIATATTSTAAVAPAELAELAALGAVPLAVSATTSGQVVVEPVARTSSTGPDTLAHASEVIEAPTSTAAMLAVAPPSPSPSPEPSAEAAPHAATAATAPSPAPPAPSPAARAPPPLRRGEGALTVVAREGGTIFVDGRRAGATPLLHHRLPAGRHLVALRRPGDTRPRWQARTIVHEGRHLRIELK